jgi:hypothetical protein
VDIDVLNFALFALHGAAAISLSITVLPECFVERVFVSITPINRANLVVELGCNIDPAV